MSAKLDRAGLDGVMQPLLGALDEALRAEFGERVGMALFVFPLNAQNIWVAYGSNAERADMIVAVKEWLARAEAGLGSDRDGLTTWLVRRQIDGAIIGTHEHVIMVTRRNDGTLSGVVSGHPATSETDYLNVIGEDRAAEIADWLNNHSDGGHKWHAVRARP